MHPINALGITLLAAACISGPALAQTASTARPASPAAVPAEWTLSADGQHIVLTRSRLVWPRCVEGLRWNGKTCVGTPLWVDHAQALEHARQRSQADGLTWRLPSARELQLISQHNQRAVDTEQVAPLPEPSLGWCWSGTTHVIRQQVNPYSYNTIARGTTGGVGGQQLDLQNGWAVNTGTAEMRVDIFRGTPMMLRLVRAADRPD